MPFATVQFTIGIGTGAIGSANSHEIMLYLDVNKSDNKIKDHYFFKGHQRLKKVGFVAETTNQDVSEEGS